MEFSTSVIGTSMVPGERRSKKAEKKKEVKSSTMELSSKIDLRPLSKEAQSNAILMTSKEFEKLPSVRHLAIGIRLYSAEEVERISVGAVLNTKSTQKTGTLDDPKMGTIGSTSICATCTSVDCPGHYMHIPFAEPIYHPMYLSTKNNTILKIFSCLCPSCGKTFLDQDTINMHGINKLTGTARLNAVSALSVGFNCRFQGPETEKTRQCQGKVEYDSTKSKQNGTIYYKRDDVEGIIPASKGISMLNDLTDEDAQLMGFADKTVPPRFIMKNILVPPHNTRSPKIINGAQQPNNITQMLESIVSVNVNLRNAKFRNIQNDVVSVPKLTRDLFNAVLKLMEFISSLIQSKDALIRALINSKRSGFCARAVIGPDDSIEVGQVVIPAYMISSLTPSEIVTAENRSYLQQLLEDGRITFVTPDTGSKAGMVLQAHPKMVLEIGDKVERWLQNGDFVIINRQPTLHKHNILACRAVIQGNRHTIGIHLSYTPGTNADHDGDEMTVIAVVNPEEMKEAEENLFVCKNIMSSQVFPIVAPVYDSVTGAFLLTRDEQYVTDAMFMDTMMILKNQKQLKTLFYRLKLNGVYWLSGKAYFSMLLPEDFSYNKENVYIRQGILLRGEIKKMHLSTSPRSIVHDLFNQYGWEVASNFITDATRTIRLYLDYYGHSVGYSDCMYGDNDEVRKLVKNAIEDAETMGMAIDLPDGDEREALVASIVDAAKKEGDKIIDYVTVSNRILQMSSEGGGAKGSRNNTSRIAGGPVQQIYNGQRMPKIMAQGTRTINTFRAGFETLRSRGLMVHGYFEGLSPDQLFYELMGNREGLSSTATTTQDIGTIQRRLAMSMIDTRTHPNGAVCIGDFQLEGLYGGDGFNGEELVQIKGGKISFIDMSVYIRQMNAEKGWVQKGAMPLTIESKSSTSYYRAKEYMDSLLLWRLEVNKIIRRGGGDIPEFRLYDGELMDLDKEYMNYLHEYSQTAKDTISMSYSDFKENYNLTKGKEEKIENERIGQDANTSYDWGISSYGSNLDVLAGIGIDTAYDMGVVYGDNDDVEF